jgi:hypothetical protein
MFHKIKAIAPLDDFRLVVQFSEGITKIWDAKTWFSKYPAFRYFEQCPEHFSDAVVDVGGYGVYWDDDRDMGCNSIFEEGKAIASPFEGLVALSDATKMWGLSESALRKAIAYGKLVNGVDVCKFGTQWVVSAKAMRREYGDPR